MSSMQKELLKNYSTSFRERPKENKNSFTYKMFSPDLAQQR
jgi:hypothetical protein